MADNEQIEDWVKRVREVIPTKYSFPIGLMRTRECTFSYSRNDDWFLWGLIAEVSGFNHTQKRVYRELMKEQRKIEK